MRKKETNENNIKSMMIQISIEIEETKKKLKELCTVRQYLLKKHPAAESFNMHNRFKDICATEAAETILREAKEPVPMEHLVKQILAGGHKSTYSKIRASLYTSFGRQKDKFVNVSPGVFMLANKVSDKENEA